MKNHGEFANDLQKLFADGGRVITVTDIIRLTTMGVAPEGRGNPILNRIVDSIYALSTTPLNVTPQKAPPETIPPKPKFTLGAKSQGKLAFLLPELAKVVEAAIELSLIDFTVTQTIRSLEEQKAAVASGHSRTMQSLHLKQIDGFAHAVDLAAWVNGTISWADPFYADIAYAMDQAATQQGVAQHIRWGGAWDRRLSDFGGSHAAYAQEIQLYRQRHPGSDLIDQPHFEWHF